MLPICLTPTYHRFVASLLLALTLLCFPSISELVRLNKRLFSRSGQTKNNVLASKEKVARAFSPQCNLHAGNNQVPKLVVAGAQKAGTSAVWEILRNHPQFRESSVNWPTTRETHFWTRKVQQDDQLMHLQNLTSHSDLTDDMICSLRERYAAHWDFSSKDERIVEEGLEEYGDETIIAYEKTPNYLPQPYVPSLLKRVCPWVKILILLRNPVDRAYSNYKMLVKRAQKDNATAPMPSFDVVVRREVDELRKHGLSHAPLLDEVNDDANNDAERWQIPKDLTVSYRYSALPYDPIQSILRRGFYAEQLMPWIQHFELGNNMMIVQYQAQFQQNHGATMESIQDFVGSSRYDFGEEVMEKNYHKVKSEETISENTRLYLQKFYKPYNDELAELLGDNWRDIWS